MPRLQFFIADYVVMRLLQFTTLMSSDDMAALLPAPSSVPKDRKAAFDAATKTTKKTSPVRAVFERVFAQDPSLTELALNVGETDNMLNMEFTMVRAS